MWPFGAIHSSKFLLSTMGQALFLPPGISSEQGIEGSCSPGAFSLVVGNRKQVNKIISGGDVCCKEIRGDWCGAEGL